MKQAQASLRPVEALRLAGRIAAARPRFAVGYAIVLAVALGAVFAP